MKKVINRNNYTYDYTTRKLEKTIGESLAVPNEAISIREILERFTQGYEVIQKPVSYSDSDDFDDYDETSAPDFDLTDAQAIKESIIDKLRDRQEKRRQEQQSAADKAKSEASEASVRPSDV